MPFAATNADSWVPPTAVAITRARTSFTLVMLAIAGMMALLLGILGIHSVISYGVSQRRRDRHPSAVGRTRGELKWMFVRSALLFTSVGVVIGMGTAAALMQLMVSVLFAVSPLDPVTYITMPLFLAASAIFASYLPARHAAAADPAEALRTE